MTARYLMALALGLGLSACGTAAGTDATDSKTDENTGDDDDDDDDNAGEPTGPTGEPAPDGFDVAVMTIDADLTFDAGTNQLVSATSYGYTIPSGLYISFGTAAWEASNFDGAQTDEYCIIFLPFTSSALAPWAATDPTVWYGVDYTGTTGDVLTTCVDDFALTSIFGDYDPVDTIVNQYATWGLGIGEHGVDVTDQVTTDTFFEMFVGARVLGNGFLPSYDDAFTAFPVAIDPTTYEAQVEDGYYVSVPAADVYNGAGIATAWYRISGVYYYIFN